MTHADLISRLEALDGPNYRMDCDILEATHDNKARVSFPSPPNYTASLDAAIALCEKTLPGWYWIVRRDGAAQIHDGDGTSPLVGFGETPAIALLIAMFKALEEKE